LSPTVDQAKHKFQLHVLQPPPQLGGPRCDHDSCAFCAACERKKLKSKKYDEYAQLADAVAERMVSGAPGTPQNRGGIVGSAVGAVTGTVTGVYGATAGGFKRLFSRSASFDKAHADALGDEINAEFGKKYSYQERAHLPDTVNTLNTGSTTKEVYGPMLPTAGPDTQPIALDKQRASIKYPAFCRTAGEQAVWASLPESVRELFDTVQKSQDEWKQKWEANKKKFNSNLSLLILNDTGLKLLSLIILIILNYNSNSCSDDSNGILVNSLQYDVFLYSEYEDFNENQGPIYDIVYHDT
jgi:hypothetical protein